MPVPQRYVYRDYDFQGRFDDAEMERRGEMNYYPTPFSDPHWAPPRLGYYIGTGEPVEGPEPPSQEFSTGDDFIGPLEYGGGTWRGPPSDIPGGFVGPPAPPVYGPRRDQPDPLPGYGDDWVSPDYVGPLPEAPGYRRRVTRRYDTYPYVIPNGNQEFSTGGGMFGSGPNVAQQEAAYQALPENQPLYDAYTRRLTPPTPPSVDHGGTPTYRQKPVEGCWSFHYALGYPGWMEDTEGLPARICFGVRFR